MSTGFGLKGVETSIHCVALLSMVTESKLVLPDLTEGVVGDVLGGGFLERVYERALVLELRARGLGVEQQAGYAVRYKGEVVGEYVADLVVAGEMVVELKCVDRLANDHLAQVLNYLRASGLRVGLLVNFQRSRLEWKRVVL